MCMEVAEVLPEYGEQNLADRDFGGGGGVASRQWSGQPLVVRALWVELRLSYLNQWFGTAHSAPGAR